MISSIATEWMPQAAGECIVADIGRLASDGECASATSDGAAGPGEALDSSPPDATVGWLLLHARQHMQGRT